MMTCTECGAGFSPDDDETDMLGFVAAEQKPVPEAFAEAAPSRPVCCWCRKPIKGVVRLQGGSRAHPCHERCLVEIRRSPDGGI